MEQGHIPGDRVVDLYLHNQLTSQERTDFEAHLVDCEECRDRVLLAEMFYVRNGLERKLQHEEEPPEPNVEIVFQPDWMALPQRARFVADLEPWQIWVILTIAALLLVLIPTSYFVLAGR